MIRISNSELAVHRQRSKVALCSIWLFSVGLYAKVSLTGGCEKWILQVLPRFLHATKWECLRADIQQVVKALL